MIGITLDASLWVSPADFYLAWIKAVDAPAWHGHNLDAVMDGLRGGVNGVDPPLTLTLVGSAAAPHPMPAFFASLAQVFTDAADEGLTVRLILA